MNFEQAVLDPAAVYAHPEEVLSDDSLDREQKIKIRRRWEYDARELEVADDENMAGGPPSVLDQVLQALHRLDAEIDVDHTSPTKQGGS